jgi:hypothetical protein
MEGDKLASGAKSAQFHGPKLRYAQDEQFVDLRAMPAAKFKEKYMVTQREYDMLVVSDGTSVDSLAKEMEEHAEVIERLLEQDKSEDRALKRECFLEPFLALGMSGRVIVTRDLPVARAEQSKLALPRHLRKVRERLPTTGHVIRARVVSEVGEEIGANFVGKRILFGPMSGQAITFKEFPVWIILEVSEILAWVHREDAEVVEEELEPLT